MEENKIFAGGGMDQDSAPEFVERNDLIEAFNIVLTGNTQQEAGNGTNLASTVEILGYSLPAGLNKCIGAARFESSRKAYFFIYNSFGNHQLVEFDYDTSLNTLLFTDLIDSAGIAILPLTASNYIMDIKLVDDKILVFTDSNLEIGYINIERLKNGTYGVLTIDDFRLIKAQALKVPTAVYGDDGGRVVNLLNGKLFQFNQQFIYLDEEPSAYSTWSKRTAPTKQSTTSVGEDVTKNNNLIVTVDIGSNRVKDINIAARYSLFDWFTIKSVTRNYVLSLPNDPIDISNEIYERYNPTDNTYSFVFYNDGSYVNIDPVETDLEYDRVPHKAQTLELLESNILTVGGITEGYNRPVADVNITVNSYDPKLEVGSFDPDPLRVITMYDTDPDGVTHKRRIWVFFDGIAKTGDKITITVSDFRNASATRVYSSIVDSSNNNNTLGALQELAAGITSTGAVAVAYPSGSEFVITWIDFPYYSAATGSSAIVDLSSVGTGQLSSIHALKGNSTYQAALQYYDRYGRTFPLITGNNFIFKTSSYAQSKGLTPRMSWQILSPPPVGAVSYQWLLSENTTHQTTLFINAKYVSTDGDYMTLYIDPLLVFNNRNSSSILNYEYSEGDRCTFMYYNNGGTKVYFDNPFIDVQVAGFEIKIDTTPDPDVTHYVLKVKQNSNISIPDITGKNIYIEIYTPKKRVVINGGTTTYLTNLFYEVGEQFNITNGVHDVTSGTITDGDIYFQTRDYVSAVDLTTYNTYLAEDFNFSPLYVSSYTSYGRGFLYNERDGIIVRKAGIRYSDKFVYQSKLNMLNRFFSERLYGDGDGESSSTHGFIRKLRLRDNYLVCIQELKVGHIPVFNTIVEDQAGQTQAFLSDKLLNKIRYSQTGNIGMGNARECYSESPNGTIYFVDPNNSVPMREGYDGLTDISKKMSKFFKSTIQSAKQAGRFVISYWDNYTKTMVLSTQVTSDVVTQVPINSESLKYQDDYIIPKTEITITQQMTKGVVAFSAGEWVITPNLGETGSDSFKFSFVVDGDTIEKNACVIIEAGDQNVNPFVFTDVTNAELSTLYSDSVFITGNTIPLTISIVSGEYRINEGSWTTANGIVNPLDTVEVRKTSSALYSTMVSTTLTVGVYSDTFNITTKDDTTPDPFTFTTVSNAQLSTLYISNTVTITGINVPVPISVIAGEYQINALPWTNIAGTINSGDTVKVRQTSSATYSTISTCALTVGTVIEQWDVITKADDVPDAFTFTPVTNAIISTVYESNGITVMGITTSSNISIVDGEYQVNGGLWTSLPDSVVLNDVVKVRRTSSATPATAVTTTLTIGGVNGVFTITTA